jgi:hypothetical protein
MSDEWIACIVHPVALPAQLAEHVPLTVGLKNATL